MKKLILIFILSFNISFYAQSTYKISTKKGISKNGFQLRLKSVFDDSRCPEGVTCIWAGEVSATIEVYKAKKLVEEKNILFNSVNRLENINWFENYFQNKIKSIGVLPYPKERVTLNPKKQYISIVFVD
jgi:hypothetical protein